LTYSYESGALNESFSDIFGISTDFFARPSTANWTLGDQSYTPATSGDGIRYMNNPNLEGDPDTYHGTNWYTGTGDNGGVHYNSGVQNFWYYLLCTGGVGTNDVGFSYNVAGITMNKARQIAYRNNTFYLTSGSQYADAAFYAVKSANDIFGNCSSESFSTKNAWDAVGVVGAPLNSAATASVVGGTCSGSTIQFTAAGGITYSWSGPGGFTSSIANPTIPNATATNNGLYSCIITDASGCSGLATAVVSVSASPSVTATGGTTICNGGSVQLNANASASGQGQNSGSNSTALALPDYPNAGVSSNININGSTNASSILSVTIDSLTHTYDGDLKIELISPSGSSIILASNVGSSGDNFIRTKFVSSGTSIANGTAPFTGSFVPSAGSFAGLTGSANGTWSLKITDLGSQDIGTLWKWSIELPGNVIVSYNWTPSTGLNSSTINNPVASPASTTTYTVQVADNSGCTATSSTTVTIGTLAVQTTQTNVSCNSGSNGAVSIAFVNPVGTPTYLWNTGATTSSLTNIPAGTYIYTITNGNGCTTTGGISISQPFVLDGTASSTPASCGSANGSASIAVAGGTSPYTYSWSNGVTTATNNNLTAGTYTITVTDHNGCSFSSSITVASQGTGGTLTTPTSITGTKNGVCPGSTKVYSCPTVANATNYTWTIPANAVINSGQGTNSINVSFLAGFTTGSITVTASNGCATSNTKSATLRSTPLTPGAITGTTSNLCNSISNYSIAASTTGATSYTWSVPAGATITSGQGTTAITVQWPSNSVASGSICVTANNACGSSTSKCLATVTTLPLMPSTVSGPGTACKNQTGLVYSVTGQAGATYTWTVPAKATIVSGQGTPSITVNWGPSTGSVKVTASNSCGTQTTKTKSVVVNCRTGFETISTMELIPNPNDGNATIVVGDEESNYEVIVNDMLGRTILKDNSTAAEYNLHLENQPKGMYLVSVRKTSGENQIFRMIIQ
jgi:subtilisin-like proprotein convertase family protein